MKHASNIAVICPECGQTAIIENWLTDDIKDIRCKEHKDTNLIVYESQSEAFIGEAITEYLTDYNKYRSNTQ